MTAWLDILLNRLTMYRLMLYFLLILLVLAFSFSWFDLLPYSASDILIQAAALAVICWLANRLLASWLEIKSNPESSLITALILALIIGPLPVSAGWLIWLLAGILAIGSKYLAAAGNNHIFNPAAFGAVGTALVLGEPASWWIGSGPMFIFILIGILLILHKLERFYLALVFLGGYSLLLSAALAAAQAELGTIILTFNNLFLLSPILFFTGVLLIEPLTSPKTRRQRFYYGGLVAVLFFSFQRFLPAITFPLELSLLVGNIFSRLAGRDFRQTLTLRRKEQYSPDITGFWFEPIRPIIFTAGQFLEYTLPHDRPDSRGIRRYFTIASAATETGILLTARFTDRGSSFKQYLQRLEVGDQIIASSVGGDFILPANPAIKLAFIAGGIGITPFRSMIKYSLNTGEKRDIVLIYACQVKEDLVFKEIFDEAAGRFGQKNVYVLSDKDKAPADWIGGIGLVDEKLIREAISDFSSRIFYVSGPEVMVKATEKTLATMNLPARQIKRDYFPGYE